MTKSISNLNYLLFSKASLERKTPFSCTNKGVLLDSKTINSIHSREYRSSKIYFLLERAEGRTQNIHIKHKHTRIELFNQYHSNTSVEEI